MSGTYSTLYAEGGWVVMHATQDGLCWCPVSKPQATQEQAETLANILREQAGQPKKVPGILTVAELVRQLQALGIEAQDLPVVRTDTDWGFIPVKSGAEITFAEDFEEGRGWTTDTANDWDGKANTKVVKLS